MNQRKCKTMQVGNSMVVVLPKDWTRGQHIEPGDVLDVIYNGIVKFSVPRDKGGEEEDERGRESEAGSA